MRRTKAAAEEIVRDGLVDGSVIILRPTNIFSPETIAQWFDRRINVPSISLSKGTSTHILSTSKMLPLPLSISCKPTIVRQSHHLSYIPTKSRQIGIAISGRCSLVSAERRPP